VSRNRKMDWDRSAQETRAAREHISGPEHLRVRRNTRLDGWIEGQTTRFNTTCEQCSCVIPAGGACQMKPPTKPSGRWRIRHEDCAPPG
jgi:hypothetical protein